MSNWASDEDCNPSSFDEMAIYPEAKELLEFFYASGDVPHIIFHGDTGTGKTTAANLLARKLKPTFADANVFDCGGGKGKKDMDEWVVQLVGAKGGLTKFFSSPDPECFIFDEFHNINEKVQTTLNKPLETIARNTPCFFLVNNLDEVAPPIKDRCTLIPFDVCSVSPNDGKLKMFPHHSWSEKDWKNELRRVGRIATRKKGYDVVSSIEDKVLATNLACVSVRTYIRKLGQSYDMRNFYEKTEEK